MKKTIGIIGFGNMGSCIASNLKSQADKYEIWVFDRDNIKITGLVGINLAKDNADLVDKSEVVILAVKPQELDSVMFEITGRVKDKLVISIVAGITTAYIEMHLAKARVVRVMPNMPSRVGEGLACLCKGRFSDDNDFLLAQKIFYCLGKTMRLEEKMMNAATVISGSGPAYFFDFIESKGFASGGTIPGQIKKEFLDALEKAARSIGFNIAQAAFLASSTVSGSQSLLNKTGSTPAELKKQIASKGGTTEAALEVLHKGGLLEEAVKQALRRAEELSRGAK